MAYGPGKYDDLATELRAKAQAVGVIVLIFEGNQGDGFAAQLPLELTMLIPTILREMATEIEASGGPLAGRS